MTLLGDIAHVRTGDKGDTCQIAVIAYRAEDYARLDAAVTIAAVRAHLPALTIRSARRYAVPELGAVNIVFEGALTGGVTRSLALDAHGKTIGCQLLDLPIPDAAMERP